MVEVHVLRFNCNLRGKKIKIDLLRKGRGPALLDVLCYRQTGHSPSDQSSYRVREEIDMWRAVDPLTEFGQKLIEAGVVTSSGLDAIRAYAARKVRKGRTSKSWEIASDWLTSLL